MKGIVAWCCALFMLTPALGQGTLVVANKIDNSVSIVNLKTYQQLARIEVGTGPHEVAVSPSGRMVAVAVYGNKAEVGNTVTIIDLQKMDKVKDILLGEFSRPHGMEFINESELIVTSESKRTLLKINIVTSTVSVVAWTEQLLSHMVAYSKINNIAYVANIASGSVSMIDVSTNTLLRQLEFRKGIEGISVSPQGTEVWVANREDSTVSAMSTTSFQLLGTMPAHQVAYRIKHINNGRHVVVSNGMSGNLSVYDVETKKWLRDIALANNGGAKGETRPVPVGIASSNQLGLVFVSLAGYDQVAVVDTTSWTVIRYLDVGDGPDGIYYSSYQAP